MPTLDRRWTQPVLWGALALGLAARLYLALGDDGIYWPDEVYQSLEPAHRLVYGYGLVAWEFVDGARNWALPGLVAGLLKLCQWVGLDEPRQYLGVVKGLFALCGAATAYGTYRLARASGADEPSAGVTGAACALAAPLIYFSPRAMSETASALPVVLGLALALERRAPRWKLVLGASLLGAAVLLRLQSGLFCVGLLGVLAARKEWRPALTSLCVFAVWAAAFGLLDHLTWADAPGAQWGGWFHSALKYLQFNLVEDRSKAWGTSDAGYYAKHLFLSMPALAVLTGLLAVASFRRAAGLALMAAAFLAMHHWVGHKELRFLYPVLPVLFALAGVGLSSLPTRVAQIALPATLAAALWSGAGFHSLTMGDVGQYPDRPQSSAYDDFGPVNRMLLAAHDRADLCGVRVDVAHLAWSGGSTYLHRPVPLYHLGQPPLELRLFNYLVTFDQPRLPGEIVFRDSRSPSVVLVRLPQGGCATEPGYRWRLP